MRYTETSSILKYNEYGDFFLSESNSVSFSYQPIGSVTSNVKTGYEGKRYIIANAEDALYVLCQEARKNGADGIINLKFTYNWVKLKTGETALSDVSASGMAIRRR